MSSYNYSFLYEDRGELHTSRWTLEGIATKAAASNLKDGRLFVTFAKTDDTVQVDAYKDDALSDGSKVLTGSADISGIATAPVKCTLAAPSATDSGLSGSFYFHSYTSDPANAYVELLVVLCDDSDLDDEYDRCADLPNYGATAGMAQFCMAATQKVLLLVSQLHRESLGGYGAPEHQYHLGAVRSYPDYRRIANPDQLKEAAVHWALMLAFGASHEMAQDTMYSTLRDFHDEKRKEAIAAWNLAFNTDPSSDDDADTGQAASMVRLERL